MTIIEIKKGLELPLQGPPEEVIVPAPKAQTAALLGDDYVDMRPTMLVALGERVKIGTPLFECKKNKGVLFTSPAGGIVKEINRGEKRVFQSIVVEIDPQNEEAVQFNTYSSDVIHKLTREQIVQQLTESGWWTAIRTRPFSKIPAIDSRPHSIFVTAMDSNPLTIDPEIVIDRYYADFQNGLKIVGKLTAEKVYLCLKGSTKLKGPFGEAVEIKKFAGPHPAGNVGTHMHYIDPVNGGKCNWHINYHDIIAMGKLFVEGKLWIEKIVALGGPEIKKPRLIQTRLGANIQEIIRDQIVDDGQSRIISGSVFNGHQAVGPTVYLGRYHHQITVLPEGRQREFLGWALPGANKFSLKNVFLAKILPARKFQINTAINGGRRAMVPIGAYEKVMPGNFLPTQLLRALLVKDTDQAQLLGCLELDEEDLALCTFVCPCKIDYGQILRENLRIIEKEG